MKRRFTYQRQAKLFGSILWSAHYHSGQWSREYRIGCRARRLFTESMEAGERILSQLFDTLEGYVSGDTEDRPPVAVRPEWADAARGEYKRLAAISENQ